MQAGEVMNPTEGRSVLHTALRAAADDVVTLDGVNVVKDVHEVASCRHAAVLCPLFCADCAASDLPCSPAYAVLPRVQADDPSRRCSAA